MSKGEITLDKLSPGIDYYICMAVTSSGGSSSISEPEKVQTLPGKRVISEYKKSCLYLYSLLLDRNFSMANWNELSMSF